MAQVVIRINGRDYTMQCDDGQEEHLRGLARMIDEEIAAIRESVGPLGDLRLLIMASLVIADRLSDARHEAAALQEQLTALHAARRQEGGAEQHAAAALREATRKLTILRDAARRTTKSES